MNFFIYIFGCWIFCLIWLVKKTILCLVKKTTNQVGHVQIDLSSMIKWSNWPNVKMLGFWSSFPIKLTMISSGWSCTSRILVLNSYVFIFESHNLVLFFIWKLNLNISFSLCSCDSSYFWQMSYIKHKNFQNIIFNLLAYHIFLFHLFHGSCLGNCKS